MMLAGAAVDVGAAGTAVPPRVLVIEDDVVQRAFLRRLLARAGVVDVAEAEDGTRALELAAEARSPFDIAICDLNMPRMDGMALLSRLAQLEAAPAIVLSSAQDAGLVYAVELMARELDLDVLGVLSKPPQLAHLCDLIARPRSRAARRAPARALALDADEVAAALAHHAFVPFFQPKVRLVDGCASGAEILVRWPHPAHGMVSPAAFLPLVAEANGFQALTLSLLHQAIPLLLRARTLLPEFRLALNVEASTLSDRAFCEALTATVRLHGCEPAWFTLEITEGETLGKLAPALEQIARLRMNGFGLAIDDFGTGYSSLQQLSRLPFSELKLDRSFVHGAHAAPSKRALVDASVDLARRLSMRTVAEGVEDPADLEVVRAAGYDEVQGFIFARPMPADDLMDWLARGPMPH